jgi:cytochrome P450
MTRTTQPAQFASWEPEYTTNPYPFLENLRAGPAAHRAIVDGLAVWVVSRYDEVRGLMTNPAFSNDPEHASPEAAAVPWVGAGRSGAARHMLRRDPPDHTRLRRLVSKAFTPRRVAAFRPRIAELVESLLAGFRADGHAELITQFAQPLPLTVIAEMLGVAPSDRADFLHWADVYAGSNAGDPAQAPLAVARLTGYATDLIAERSRYLETSAGELSDGASLVDVLIQARDDGDRLDADELIAMCFAILIAGYETTVNLLANGTLLLLRHPAQLRALREDPALLRPAIEEFLRYEGPVKLTSVLRFATEDAKVGDVLIPAGDPVLVHLGAANRDPARFVEPDTFDIRRGEPGHLAFGYGVHHCLGASLARLEAEVAFPALLDTCRDMALAVDESALRWRSSRVVRGLRALPVTFTPYRGGVTT